MAGHHLIPVQHAVGEHADGVLVMLLQLHAHERLQAQPDLTGFQPRAVAGDHPFVLQPLYAAQAGRWGQVHPGGELGIGGAAVLLDFSQQAQIRAVELRFPGHCCSAT
ncbi:hypothetical protein D3C81_1752960 [compost metagenome]